MENADENCLCRLCLKLSGSSVSLFDYRNGHLVADLVKIICPISIEENESEKLPKFVCCECVELVIDAIHLRDVSLINDEELRRNIQEDHNFEEEKLEELENEGYEDDDQVYIEALDEATIDEETLLDDNQQTQHTSPMKPSKIPTVDDIRCDLCSLVLCNVSSFKRHMRRKHSEISYSCDLCDVQFKIKLDLMKHMNKKHIGQYEYHPMNWKTETFSDIESMMEKLEEPCWLSCCFCPYNDYDEESLNEHMREHSNVIDTGKMYCVLCPSPIHSFEFMIDHARSHNEKVKTHRCLVCLKLFPFDDKFLNHLRNHKKNQKNICFCPQCGRKFSKQRLLQDHVRFIHNKESAFCCPRCGQGFGSKSALNGHVKRHNEGNKYECPFCPKTFSSHNLLNSHKVIHSNDRPFACTMCEKRFKHQKVLNDHIKRHNGDRLLYPCTICEKSLNSAFALNRHMLVHTGSKPFQCEYCPKSYAQKNDLNKHLRSHVGENTYFCEFPTCTETFRILADLRVHEGMHYLGRDGFVEDE